MRVRIAFLTVLVLAVVVRAERPPQTKNDATHVVTGTIEKLTTQEEKFAGDGVITYYTAMLNVDKVEKGDIKAPNTFRVTWHRVTKFPTKPVAGAAGHDYMFKENDTVRAYLIAKEGKKFEPIYSQDGIEKLK